MKRANQIIEAQPTDVVVATRATFAERLEHIKAAHAQRHYDAALAARLEFEERLARLVASRAMQVLDAVVGD